MKYEKAKANPTKAFFVRMITRDIALEDCLLDLLDNSVDSAWQREGGRPSGLEDGVDLSQYTIDITANEAQFVMRDNCGGITLDDAANYAFTFGRRDDAAPDDYSIGVYGIGMKRAIFKIGSSIAIRSTYALPGGTEAFRVPINVADWLSRPQDWDFDIEADEGLAENGVELSITDLSESALATFGNPSALQNLRRTIARDYALHFHRGLNVVLNGEKIVGWNIEVRHSDEFEPMRTRYTEPVGGGTVAVEILAGMNAPPPESSEPDETRKSDDRSGWYVVCNGRIVVAADRTALSGWGSEDWPIWHPQYSGFIGLIFFTSENAALLPLTTTKRSVDQSASVYRKARPRMREASKAWIAYTNARKLRPDEARVAEVAAKPVSIFSVVPRQDVKVPTIKAVPKEPVANVAYAVPLKRMKALARGMGDINKSYRDVGLESFEYAFRDLAENED